MADSLKALLILLLIMALTRNSWTQCVSTGELTDAFDEHVTKYKYKCSSMNRQDFASEINPIIKSKLVRELELYKIDLPRIDQQLFSNSRFTKVYDKLIINNCGVSVIENKSFSVFDSTDHVYIMNNNLTYFDGSVLDGFKHLDLLDLTNNNIKQFNLNCFNRPSFIEFILNNNSLNYLNKDNFTNCIHLNIIKMGNCKINTIENDTFNNFHNLTYLDLQNNNLKNLNFLNEHFTNKLKTLDINNNNLTSFPCGIFGKNDSLTELNLNNNRMKNINDCAFQNLFSLNKLHLKNNEISILNSVIFISLTNLKYLDISENFLSHLNEPVIYLLQSVEILDISENDFKNIDTEYLLSYLNKLKQIDLSGNPWPCKTLTSICKYLQTHNVKYISKAQNYNPKFVAGIECVDIEITEYENTDLPVPDYRIDNYNKSILTDIINILKDTKNNTEHIKEIENISNKTLYSLINMESKNYSSNIFYLLVFVFIYFVSYKIICFMYKYYKENQSKYNLPQNRKCAENEMELLYPETDMN